MVAAGRVYCTHHLCLGSRGANRLAAYQPDPKTSLSPLPFYIVREKRTTIFKNKKDSESTSAERVLLMHQEPIRDVVDNVILMITPTPQLARLPK